MWKFALLFCLSALASADYTGYKLLHVYPSTHQQQQLLKRLSDEGKVDIWRADDESYDIFVAPNFLSEMTSLMQRDQLPFNVSPMDVAREAAEESERLQSRSSDFNYDDFNDYQTVDKELERLASRCVTGFTCTLDSIGNTIESRQIKRLKISKNGATNRTAVWLDATTHAREWLTTATLMKIIKHIVEKYPSDKEVRHLLDTYDWYLIPVVNPDGYIYSWSDGGKHRMHRKNMRVTRTPGCYGVDLNRNTEHAWATPGSTGEDCAQTFHGLSAASEPETEALQRSFQLLRSSLTHVISIHAYGSYWLTPYGNLDPKTGRCFQSKDDPESIRVANAAADAIERVYATKWKRGPSCSTIYFSSGLIVDYAKGIAGIQYGAVPEVRGSSFIVPPSQIELSFKEIWAGVYASTRAIEKK